MARKANQLTDASIKKLRRVGMHADGGGLYLKVAKGGTKSWVFRYKKGFKEDGKPRVFNMGLGGLDEPRIEIRDGQERQYRMTLAEARSHALRARAKINEDGNPLVEKMQRMAADAAERAVKATDIAAATAANIVTFDEAAERYIASIEADWRNAKHRAQWRATLTTYASPVFGAKNVAEISTSDVERVLRPIWTKKAETASRLRGRIEKVLDYAKVAELRTGENPARWRGHLDKMFTARKKKLTVEHHPAMAFAEVPEFMADLRANGSASAKALEFTILNAVRTSEAIEAIWREIDLDAALWIIPKERMKAGVEFRVPLTDAAVALLKSLPRIDGTDDSAYLFPGARKDRPLSNMAMLELLRGMRPGLTVHGFRSSFRDWAGDSTNFPRDICESCLAHTIDSDVEAAYRRSDMIAKRRKVMDAWANFCGKGKVKGTVVPMFHRA